MIIELPPDDDSDSDDADPIRIDTTKPGARGYLAVFASWVVQNDAVLEFTYVYQQLLEGGQEIEEDEELSHSLVLYQELAQDFLARLVTKLLYDALRHGWDDDECERTRGRIIQLDANFEEFESKDYVKWITELESEQRTFFGGGIEGEGGDISDDSDIDDESVPFNDPSDLEDEEDDDGSEADDDDGGSYSLPNEDDEADQPEVTYRFADDKVYPGGETITDGMPAPKSPFKSGLVSRKENEWSQKVGENATIRYDAEDWTDVAIADLDLVNAAIAEGATDADKAAKGGTRFCVAQYRGIAYNVLSFSAVARRKNRSTYELLRPVYSSSVFAACDVSPGDFYAGECDDEIEARLQKAAEDLMEILVAKRFTKPVKVGKREFENQAYALQDYYTKSYDGFHEQLRRYFESKKSSSLSSSSGIEIEDEADEEDFWPCFEGLLNAKNPFVSTGNTPRHALRYAYGLKFYEGHSHERLRPRWLKSGRAERPYAGKIYMSLHPVNDYLFGGPLDVVSLNRQGKVSVVSLIAAERESSFPAYIPADRVICEHVARYPSFAHKYRPYFLHKYGLRKDEYNFFRVKLLGTKPHSKPHRGHKLSLGQWLVRYYEARLVEIARREAKAKGWLLVYRDEDGYLTRVLPTQMGPRSVDASRDSSSSNDDDSASDMDIGASNKVSSDKKVSGLDLPKKSAPPKVMPSKKLTYEMLRAVEQRRFRFLRWVRERFDIHRVPSDGNCLFHALKGAGGWGGDDGDLREIAVLQLQIEKLGATVMNPAPDGVVPDAVINEMAKRCTSALQYERWGTDREVGAIARAMQINILIYSPGDVNGHRLVLGTHVHVAPTAFLFHAGGNHWEWLSVRADKTAAVLQEDFV